MTGELRGLVTRLAAELEQLADWACTNGGFHHCDNTDCRRRRLLLIEAQTRAPQIVCAGRALDDQAQPTGDPCGRTYKGYVRDTDDVAASARAAGWRIGPLRPDGTRDAICPRCAKPDRAVVKLCDELTASIGGSDA